MHHFSIFGKGTNFPTIILMAKKKSETKIRVCQNNVANKGVIWSLTFLQNKDWKKDGEFNLQMQSNSPNINLCSTAM
jgi:hypothetical protein